MNPTPIEIKPRHSLAIFALLSLLMVIASYLFLLLLAVACVYLPYLVITNLDRPPGQVFALLVAGILVALTIIWSLLPRWEKFEAPGMPLKREEHPRLFRELDAIAAALKEPLPRDVYLVWGMTAFVADRGGMVGIGNRRILGIGLPLFSVLTVPELRAVLAHEFAHFYGGDTTLGPVVYKAKSAIARTFQNVGKIRSLARVLVVQLVNGFVSFVLKWYFQFFLRVINFISRKQEFRADELACLVAGAEPMREGLKKIHGASFAWFVYWQAEIDGLLKKNVLPPIGAGFEKFLSTPEVASGFQQELEEEIKEGKSDPYDTHPSLRDRLAALEKLPKIAAAAEFAYAVELLEDPQEVENKFLQTLDPRFKEKTFTFVDWDELATKVTLPEWRALIRTNFNLLAGMTTNLVPEYAKRTQEIGKKMPDPPGELLSMDQRTAKARYMLSVAVGLRLIERGWEIHSQPGDFHLYLGKEQAQVFQKIQALASGEMNAEQWVELCSKWGIAGLSLATSIPGETRAETYQDAPRLRIEI